MQVHVHVVNINSSGDQSQNTFYKWTCDKNDMFKRGLIEKLPTFNKIVNVNTYTNSTLNDMINQFSEILCSVANPLFERKVLSK